MPFPFSATLSLISKLIPLHRPCPGTFLHKTFIKFCNKEWREFISTQKHFLIALIEIRGPKTTIFGTEVVFVKKFPIVPRSCLDKVHKRTFANKLRYFYGLFYHFSCKIYTSPSSKRLEPVTRFTNWFSILEWEWMKGMIKGSLLPFTTLKLSTNGHFRSTISVSNNEAVIKASKKSERSALLDWIEFETRDKLQAAIVIGIVL